MIDRIISTTGAQHCFLGQAVNARIQLTGPLVLAGLRSFVAVLFVILSAGATSCSKAAEEPSIGASGRDSQPVKVVLAENPVPLSSITIVAREKGFFRAHGLDVDVKSFASGKLALDAVLGGAADFATVAETPLMYAGFVDQPVVVLATFTYSNNDCKVAARRDLGVSAPADLRGKKVATFVGTSAEFFMNAFLKGHGLTSNDVDVVSLKPPEMVSALERGDIAAFFIWEPAIYNAKKILGEKSVVFSGSEFYTETFNLVAMKTYAQKNPETAQSMLRALLDAEQFIRESPDEAVGLVSAATGMDASVLKGIWPDFVFEVVLDPFLLKYMREQARWAIESGTAKGKTVPDYDRMVYAVPLKLVKADAVKIPEN